MMTIRRPRTAVLLTSALAAVPLTAPRAEEVFEGHAFAMHGDIKYGADFTHFDYLNPDAPKGGAITIGVGGSFDSLNPVIIAGSAEAYAPFLALDTLMVQAFDEPFTEYCLVCETIRVPADRRWVEFDLHPDARFGDGSPMTVEDVIWSFETWTKHPRVGFYYQDVASVSQAGERTVRFDFSTSENKELPLILGQLSILPKAYWTAEGRDVSRTTLQPWVGSGPYRFARVDPGQRVIYERIPDYWAADLPVNRGNNNFDRISVEYFADQDVMFEAFLGGELDWRRENSSKNWATGYNIPEVRAGVLVQEQVEDGSAQPFQGLFFNLRRPQFQDRRVREALILAFDFEWTNANLFYSLYQRTDSIFESSELEASGPPSAEELAILEPFRDQLPPEVFERDYEPPSTEGGGLRTSLRRAVELLEEAGYHMVNGVRTNAETGTRLEMEILLDSPTWERITLPYASNLERLGVRARVRTVDAAQYQERMANFDFDATIDLIAQSLSPGNEQRDYWSSAAADSPGSFNTMGLKNPAIDALIDLVISAPDREALVTRTHALDRALMWQMFAVPNWNNPYTWYAYWDKFDHARPAEPLLQGQPLFTTWWYDADKAATFEARRRAAR